RTRTGTAGCGSRAGSKELQARQLTLARPKRLSNMQRILRGDADLRLVRGCDGTPPTRRRRGTRDQGLDRYLQRVVATANVWPARACAPRRLLELSRADARGADEKQTSA